MKNPQGILVMLHILTLWMEPYNLSGVLQTYFLVYEENQALWHEFEGYEIATLIYISILGVCWLTAVMPALLTAKAAISTNRAAKNRLAGKNWVKAVMWCGIGFGVLEVLFASAALVSSYAPGMGLWRMLFIYAMLAIRFGFYISSLRWHSRLVR